VFYTYMLQRRRECANGHKFKTYEVFAGNLDRRTLPSTQAGMRRAAIASNRREFIRKHPKMPSGTLAHLLGITDMRVRQIRKELEHG
jgi:hypothetical protein